MDPLPPNRRDFLSGKALQRQLAEAGGIFADSLDDAERVGLPPECGPTVRLGKQAMACDFDVILNPGLVARLDVAAMALDVIDELEDQLSVYRAESEVSRLNVRAAEGWVEVEPRLFELLLLAREMSEATAGGFDVTTGPLIALWRRCKAEYRLPTTDEISEAQRLTGISQVLFDPERRAVRFPRAGMEFNLGSIGKGYALDRAAELMVEQGVAEFLLHGGKSSLLARGPHDCYPGWPIGISNPLFPEKTLATILLVNAGLSTSGSNIQYFRLEGKRYGHILDPRTGWPAEGLASVTVLAPTATIAEALSTAFFVIGVENARQYCHNHPEIKALLIPAPQPGQRLRIVNCGLPADELFLGEDVSHLDITS
ncbi:MAG: apbE 3 [Planctomycetaceae bacterium]|nr:apbE 3 [Planctomycetaceae bacterium]